MTHAVNTATCTQTNQRLSGEIKNWTHMNVDIKVRDSTWGVMVLKEDPAGYYGMPGIC